MAENIDYKASIGGGAETAPNHRAEANSVDKTLHDLRDRYRAGVFTENNNLYPEGGAPSNKFPVQLTSPDPRDEKIALKRQLIGNKTSGATPFGMATLTDEDMNWLESKRKMKSYLALNEFIDNCELPSSSSAHRRLTPSQTTT